MFEQLTGLLRRLVREAEGRGAEPSACVLDSQTIKTSANVHLKDQGTDAGKRITGRRRHLGCDTPGLLLTVLVTAACVSDTAAGVSVLSRIAAAHPHITKAWADAGYRTTAVDHGARLGIDVHPVQHPPGARGFTIIPRRWTIERSTGWLMHHRRLARDYETHPERPGFGECPGQAQLGSVRDDGRMRRGEGLQVHAGHLPPQLAQLSDGGISLRLLLSPLRLTASPVQLRD